MNKKEFTAYRKGMIVGLLKKPRTANEVISEIFYNDLRKGSEYIIKERGWKFYVHLNKLFSPLEKEGYIEHVGERGGEKLWKMCAGVEHLI